jgi:hypothetical protein
VICRDSAYRQVQTTRIRISGFEYWLGGAQHDSRTWSAAKNFKKFLKYNRGHWVGNNPVHVADIAFFKFDNHDGSGYRMNHTAMISKLTYNLGDTGWNAIRFVESDNDYAARRLQDGYNALVHGYYRVAVYIWRIDG